MTYFDEAKREGISLAENVMIGVLTFLHTKKNEGKTLDDVIAEYENAFTALTRTLHKGE